MSNIKVEEGNEEVISDLEPLEQAGDQVELTGPESLTIDVDLIPSNQPLKTQPPSEEGNQVSKQMMKTKQKLNAKTQSRLSRTGVVSSNKDSRHRLMTYQEYRQMLKQQESQHIGPGAYRGNDIDFGQDAYYKVTISASKKYNPKKDNFPSPDSYNPKRSETMTKPRAPSAQILNKHRSKRPKPSSPDAGYYDTIQEFGKGAPSFTMYQPIMTKKGNSMVEINPLQRSRSCFVSTPINVYLNKSQKTPDPYQNENEFLSFGKNAK